VGLASPIGRFTLEIRKATIMRTAEFRSLAAKGGPCFLLLVCSFLERGCFIVRSVVDSGAFIWRYYETDLDSFTPSPVHASSDPQALTTTNFDNKHLAKETRSKAGCPNHPNNSKAYSTLMQML
jgi:hypothetical protein